MSDTTSSTTESDGLSYFTLASRQVRSVSDSPSISPSTAVLSFSTSSAPIRSVRRRNRPRSNSRTKSDEGAGYSRPRVQTIDEDQPSNDGTSQGVGNPFRPGLVRGAPHHSSDTKRGHGSVPESQGSSSRTSFRSFTRKLCFTSAPDLTEPHAASVPMEKSKPGRNRARSESGGRGNKSKVSCLFKRHLTRPADVACRRKSYSHSSHNIAPPSPVIPLRPPPSSNIGSRGPSYHHIITIEKPFSPPHSSPTRQSAQIGPPPSRRSSIFQDILIAPLVFVRRFSKTKSPTPILRNQKATSTSTSTSEGHVPVLRGHTTQLRKNRTQEALRQVSNILRNVTGDIPGSQPSNPFPKPLQIRSMSDKSAISFASKDKVKLNATAEGVPLPGSILAQKSMELNISASESSSIRKLRLGPPPNATPDELATYKIKRSPSTETEEFLRVDISIRGGTSYLPSEARRIHTPPLPRENITGKRRGFFFDYNAPRHFLSEDLKPCKTNNQILPFDEHGAERGEVHRGMASSANTIDRKTYAYSRTGKRPGGDWYDRQLAELDVEDECNDDERKEADEEGGADATLQALDFHQMRERTALALCNMRHRRGSGSEKSKSTLIQRERLIASKIEDEGKEDMGVDYSIPEHLPTSPLCLANLRYWRFVEGKIKNHGRFARVCWMHGGLLENNLKSSGDGRVPHRD